jgi:hypothetical protein
LTLCIIILQGKVMRLNLDYLYKILSIPRTSREVGHNPLKGIQICNWSAVPLKWDRNWQTLDTMASQGKLIKGERNISAQGRKLEDYLSAEFGVVVEFPEPKPDFLMGVVQSLLSAAASLVPVIGPLLAIGVDIVFDGVRDPEGFAEELTSLDFGLDLILALVDSAGQYKDVSKKKKKKKTSRGTFEEPEDTGYLGRSAQGLIVVTVRANEIGDGNQAWGTLGNTQTPVEEERARKYPRDAEGNPVAGSTDLKEEIEPVDENPALVVADEQGGFLGGRIGTAAVADPMDLLAASTAGE